MHRSARPVLLGTCLLATIVPHRAVVAQQAQTAMTVPGVSRNENARRAAAEPRRARRAAFGFSYLTYYIEQDDGVFTEAQDRTTQNFGFRLSTSLLPARRIGVMIDGELFLGVLDRELVDVPLPETIFGLQAFVGPQLRLGKLTVNVAAGVNRVSIPGSELVTSPRGTVIQYVGRGGLSSLWAALLNELAAQNKPTVIASIKEYKNTAPAGLLGLAYDFGGARGPGLRLSAEFTPVFAEKSTKNNFRLTFSITG